MRRIGSMKLMLPTIAGFLALSPGLHAASCEALKQLYLTHGTITTAVSEQTNIPVPVGTASIHDLPPFCRVSFVLTPVPDSKISVEIWLPAESWNGRFEGTGNGGFAGLVNEHALVDGLRRGYAVANTDMGTAPAATSGGDVLIGHPEKWADWGSRATHEMTLAAKAILLAFYGRAPMHSYFNGCSTGGEQGLMEAQRYPDDYDGIISGAPAHNRTRLHMEILWNFAVVESAPAALIPAEKLALISQAVLKACTAQKAVSSDAFLSLDPAACHWNPQTLACKAGNKPDCLTAEEVSMAKKIYAGPVNPTSHVALYPGVEPGSEFGWNQFVPRDGTVPYGSIFHWVFGPQWKWQAFDFNHDVATMDARLAPVVNAINPDLHAFRAAGHKLILYHGWSDWLVPPRETINYYSMVRANTANAQDQDHDSLHATREFARLFLIPGMGHCSSGPGLNGVDALAPLEQWVESGLAPDSLPAWRDDGGSRTLTRPVCAYPSVARYTGYGNPSEAKSFTCSADPGIER